MKKALLSRNSFIIQLILLFFCIYIVSCSICFPFGYYAGKLIGVTFNSTLLLPSIIIGLIIFPIFLYTIWNMPAPNLMRKVKLRVLTIFLIIFSGILIFIAGMKISLLITVLVVPVIMYASGAIWLISAVSIIRDTVAVKYMIISKSEYNKIIEDRIKSERFKTELITNVSHDIKTPLTSIVNYIDLIKRLDIQNNSLIEYINVLDKKSDRLKMLINDLLEASKAGTGNVSVNLQEIDLVEITGQIAGEFDSLFKKIELEFVFRHSEEKTTVIADGRHLWRIMENIFSNTAKYSVSNTRIYADISKEDGCVIFSLKNVSKEKLGITSDELMEQFVRGDRSRHSEGSGLGLYIARSLSELIGARFDINVIGDLFEVIIKFSPASTYTMQHNSHSY